MLNAIVTIIDNSDEEYIRYKNFIIELIKDIKTSIDADVYVYVMFKKIGMTIANNFSWISAGKYRYTIVNHSVLHNKKSDIFLQQMQSTITNELSNIPSDSFFDPFDAIFSFKKMNMPPIPKNNSSQNNEDDGAEFVPVTPSYRRSQLILSPGVFESLDQAIAIVKYRTKILRIGDFPK